MRHSIGLAEYEKKLAELQQRMISVHSPYNDSMMIDINMLAASNENSFIEQPEFEGDGSPIEEDNLNPYPATRLLSSNSSKHRKIINPALCNLDHQLLPMSDEKNYQPPKIIKKVKRLSKVVGQNLGGQNSLIRVTQITAKLEKAEAKPVMLIKEG